MTVAAPAPEHGIEVPLRDVERELSRQMRIMHGPGQAPVQRVRMSNLIVYCNKEEHVAPMVARLAEVPAVHPARVLLLVGEGKPGNGITATVKADAHAIRGSGQACTELVVLRAPAI